MNRISIVRFAHNALLGALMTLLLFAKQIAILSDPQNRFFFFWRLLDTFTIALCTVMGGLITATVDMFLRKRRRLHRFGRCLFMFALLTGPITLLPDVGDSLFPFDSADLMYTLWALAFLASGLCFLLDSRDRVATAVKSAAGLFILLPPIVLMWMVTWPTTPVYDEPLPPPINNSSGRPIIILLFDELSYYRTMVRGEVTDVMPNLKRLATQSFVFGRALSEGDRTEQAIPRLLFQTTMSPTIVDGKMEFLKGTGTIPAHRMRSLFAHARERGYQTAAVGFYLPYRQLLGSQVDWAQSRSYLPGVSNTGNLAQRAWSILRRNLRYMPRPVGSFMIGDFNRRFRRNWADITTSTESEVAEVVGQSHGRTMLFAHWNVPHPPYALTADGKFRGTNVERHTERQNSVIGYVRSMRAADCILGRTIELLHARGELDSALLIVMSDHGWRSEPYPHVFDRPGWAYRVPLVIKWPGQKWPIRVGRPFSLVQLQPLIDLAIDGRSIEEARKYIDTAPLLPIHRETGPYRDVAKQRF